MKYIACDSGKTSVTNSVAITACGINLIYIFTNISLYLIIKIYHILQNCLLISKDNYISSIYIYLYTYISVNNY